MSDSKEILLLKEVNRPKVTYIFYVWVFLDRTELDRQIYSVIYKVNLGPKRVNKSINKNSINHTIRVPYFHIP